MGEMKWQLPEGFLAGAGQGGLKAAGLPDVAIIISARPCTAAAVFTQNKFAAAPVLFDRALCRRQPDHVYGVVINAGNANAVTGKAGLQAAEAMAHFAEKQCGLPPDSFCVMSTGVIGVPLPLAKVQRGIEMARSTLSRSSLQAAAKAIMTTDTRPKWAGAVILDENGQPAGLISGIAKGAGMIHPNMATMLAVITTDLAISSSLLQKALDAAVESSFNRISVDGDTSTNDTVLLLANGAAGFPPLAAKDPLWAGFQRALNQVAISLAQQIVRDGEGATKFVIILVTGAVNDAEAVLVARAIANSPLCKTAFYGGDANWGRVVAAAGYSGAQVVPERVSLWFSGHSETEYTTSLAVLMNGASTVYNEEDATHIFSLPEIEIHLELGLGGGEAHFWTSDLSHEYVTINGNYRT